jgi:SnoaL-like domain
LSDRLVVATIAPMSEAICSLIETHWRLANARRWPEFARLLAPDMRYEVPQTREYIDGAEGYLEMFSTWPGDWRADIQRLVCDQSSAVCIIDFVIGDQTETGISVFEISAGYVAKVTDYWPAPYDPPPRATAHLKRRAP